MEYRDPDPEEIAVQVKPAGWCFTVDVSLSMKGEKLANAKKAVVENARLLIGASGSRCKVGLVSFGSSAPYCLRAHVRCRQDRKRRCQSALRRPTTAMDEGIRVAANLVGTSAFQYRP